MTGSVVRAPRSDNQDLCIPVHGQLCDQVMGNHQRWPSASVPNWILDLRNRTRNEVATAAMHYARSYTTGLQLDPSMVWVVGGHQPEFFHPGVWYKNFLIDATVKAISQRYMQAVGLHIIIDHDIPKSLSIKVPYRSEVQPSHLAIEALQLPVRPSDSSVASLQPWHRYSIDQQRMDPFIRQVETAASSLGLPVPLAREFFKTLGQHDSANDASIAISQARHVIELQAGLRSIDLPMSRVCETDAWFDFVEYCLANAEDLFRTYNRALEAYRSREKITNPGQPVAHLASASDWIELPFWLYRSSDTTRNRMWFRNHESRLELGSGSRTDELAWTMRLDSHRGALRAAIQQRAGEGVCLRPRALMTTLFLRCFLADGFVHGIGGGVYDRLTDEIISGYLGIEPPRYAIASATLYLPVPETLRRSSVDAESELEQLKKVSRTIRSAPQSHLLYNDEFQRGLLAEHSALLARMPNRGQKKIWHTQMVDLKARIRRAIDPVVQTHPLKLQNAQRRYSEAQLMSSREYSMLLFPRENCIERLKVLASRVRA